jgi:hypothetical protein
MELKLRVPVALLSKRQPRNLVQGYFWLAFRNARLQNRPIQSVLKKFFMFFFSPYRKIQAHYSKPSTSFLIHYSRICSILVVWITDNIVKQTANILLYSGTESTWSCLRPRAGLGLLADRQVPAYKLNSVAFSPQANYTDRATAVCRRS